MTGARPKIINRSEAKAAGLNRYFTGKPCKHGHISERHISGSCLQCERESKMAQYAADPEKFKSRVMAAYRKKNDGRLRHQLPQTPESLRIEKQRAAIRAHYAKNKPYYMARSSQRRAMKLRAVPAWFGELDQLVMTEANRLLRLRRIATGFSWQADHMIPLAGKEACGLHVASNIQVIPTALNKTKGNKLVFTTHGEWIRHI